MPEEKKEMTMIYTNGIVDPHKNIIFLLGCTEMILDTYSWGDGQWERILHELYLEKSRAELIINKIFNHLEMPEEVREKICSMLETSCNELDPFDIEKFNKIISDHNNIERNK